MEKEFTQEDVQAAWTDGHEAAQEEQDSPTWQDDWHASQEIRERQIARSAASMRERWENPPAWYKPDQAEQEKYETIWNAVAEGLTQLAVNRPSGDDSVFDYFPGALEAVQFVYTLYMGDGIDEIEEYPISFMYETMRFEVAAHLEAVMIACGAKIFLSDFSLEENNYSYWPESQRKPIAGSRFE